MSGATSDRVNVLRLMLHKVLVGYLLGFKNGKTVFHIAESFKADPKRPTFSLITHPQFPNANKVMFEPWRSRQRLHPVLSNLLPEGALRELLAQNLKVHVDHEFQLLSHLGEDLPGAVVALPMTPEEVPSFVLNAHGNVDAIPFDPLSQANHFSLAGVQMKFSMKAHGQRFTLSGGESFGDWIIKTPSTKHPFVPQNEYTAMSLAKLAGVDIPEIRLIDLNQLDHLPKINLPNENQAFAIKRFDRSDHQRIHMEDFAQIFVKYPHEKYSSASYENIGKVIHQYSGDGVEDAQQFARRLLVNVLLANGDAHLKNWSLVYPDQITPRLSPAYDIVTTRVYMEDETKLALSLGKTKAWYEMSLRHFQLWSEQSGIPWRIIKPHLEEVMATARELWPSELKNLPMAAEQKASLRAHWRNLQDEFKIETRG